MISAMLFILRSRIVSFSRFLFAIGLDEDELLAELGVRICTQIREGIIPRIQQHAADKEAAFFIEFGAAVIFCRSAPYAFHTDSFMVLCEGQSVAEQDLAVICVPAVQNDHTVLFLRTDFRPVFLCLQAALKSIFQHIREYGYQIHGRYRQLPVDIRGS